jgi:hypothetical protein
MSNDGIASSHAAPLTAATAFVVHLAVHGTGVPEQVQGRIEHVVSGRSTHFASSAELIGFMRQTLLHEAEPEFRG